MCLLAEFFQTKAVLIYIYMRNRNTLSVWASCAALKAIYVFSTWHMHMSYDCFLPRHELNWNWVDAVRAHAKEPKELITEITLHSSPSVRLGSAWLGCASLGSASSCLAGANTFGSMPLMGKASEGDMAREWGGERVGGRGATRKWYAHWSALQYSC